MKKLKCGLICIIIAIGILFGVTGCERRPEYYGSYVNLNTVVLNSVIGLYSLEDSRIELMDQDDFGRQMFIYLGNSSVASMQGLIALFICQKADKAYAYYYPDDCFLLYQSDSPRWMLHGKKLSDKVFELMSAEDLESLKEKNDWGKPLDETRCDKKPITRRHKEGTVKRDYKLAFYSAIGYAITNERVSTGDYLTSDGYGRHIYYSGIQPGANGQYGINYIVMYYPDGHFDYIKITDLLNYQDQMKAFKARNNWNKPIE